jgi:predicted CXXCH cytochrome family protein
MKLRLLIAVVVLLAWSSALAQFSGDVLGQHQLTVGSGSPVTGPAGQGCLYCHAPHSGLASGTALWNQKLTNTTYVPYTSSTYHQKGIPNPLLGSDSTLCLSCHDGTVAVGQTIAYGPMIMNGTMNGTDLVGAADVNNLHPLEPQHPFSLVLPLQDSPDLISTLVQGKTGDPAVNLVNGNVECTSCHDPHVQNKDRVSTTFLVRDSSKGQMCLACHDPTRTVAGQAGAGQWQKNPLTLWANSAHAQAGNQVASNANAGDYLTVAQNACISCHEPHNAPGPTRLTRAPNELDCAACHGGGANVSPAAPNVFAEYTKAGNVGHPFPQGTNIHDATEDLIGQNVVLNNNRHATCADCHNPHSSYSVGSFASLQPPSIRPSQSGVAGVSADGTTIVNPAVNQYENCLRCHGNSSGKVVNPVFGYAPVRAVAPADALSLIPQFASTATSAHPVMNPNSGAALPQPTLLPNMLNLDGITQGRTMGSQIFCTDCHNNDDSRESGGKSPNGPHGSQYSHILERQYSFAQAPVPGGLIPSQYLYPNPILDPGPTGTYALCAKCHNLNLLSLSWTGHTSHVVTDGFSCSICHTPHGMGSTSATISGQRLVNFDVNVVAPNGATPITYSYNGGSASCTLTCHGQSHNGAMASIKGPQKGHR